MLLFVLRFSPEFVPIDYLFHQSRELPGPKRLCPLCLATKLSPVGPFRTVVLRAIRSKRFNPGNSLRGESHCPKRNGSFLIGARLSTLLMGEAQANFDREKAL